MIGTEEIIASVQEIDRPALRYFGGKWSLGSWVLEHLPKHGLYCEPFGGAGSVMLKKGPSAVDVYNDLNSDVVNFFRCLRDDPERLIRLIELTPFSREECETAIEPAAGADAFEVARCFYVRCAMCFNQANAKTNSGWKYNRTAASRKNEARVFSKIDHLWPVAERLKQIHIENDDAFKVIPRFDSPEALFYVDPTYLAETRCRQWARRAYSFELTDPDHVRLLDMLCACEGKVVLSGYPSQLYDKKLGGWKRVERMGRTVGRVSKMEVLWIKP